MKGNKELTKTKIYFAYSFTLYDEDNRYKWIYNLDERHLVGHWV